MFSKLFWKHLQQNHLSKHSADSLFDNFNILLLKMFLKCVIFLNWPLFSVWMIMTAHTSQEFDEFIQCYVEWSNMTTKNKYDGQPIWPKFWAVDAQKPVVGPGSPRLGIKYNIWSWPGLRPPKLAETSGESTKMVGTTCILQKYIWLISPNKPKNFVFTHSVVLEIVQSSPLAGKTLPNRLV